MVIDPWERVLFTLRDHLRGTYAAGDLTGTCRVEIGRIPAKTPLPYQSIRVQSLPGEENTVGGFATVHAKRLQVTSVDVNYGRAMFWRGQARSALATARRGPRVIPHAAGRLEVAFVRDEDTYLDRDATAPDTNTEFEVAVSIFDLHFQAT